MSQPEQGQVWPRAWQTSSLCIFLDPLRTEESSSRQFCSWNEMAAGFEPQASGIGSNCSANEPATTTALVHYPFLRQVFDWITLPIFMFKLASTFLTPPEKGPSSHVNMFSICCVSLKVSWRDGEIIELCTEASGSFPVIIRYQISTYVIYGPPANIIYLSLCFFMDRSRLFYKQLTAHKCSIKVA